MPTPQQRIDFAIEFVMAQKSIKDCVNQPLLTHQLKAVGINLVMDGERCYAEHGRDRVEIRNTDELLRYLV